MRISANVINSDAITVNETNIAIKYSIINTNVITIINMMKILFFSLSIFEANFNDIANMTNGNTNFSVKSIKQSFIVL